MYNLNIDSHVTERNIFIKRSIYVAGFMIFLTLLILCRLFYLQVIKHDMYLTRSQKNHIQLQPIAPIRGSVYDRNGIAIAQNKYRYDLMLVREEILSDPAQVIAELGSIIDLTDEDTANFYKQLGRRQRPHQPVTLKPALQQEEIARFAVNRYRFPGIWIQSHLIRDYPFKDLFFHVLGHVGQINQQDLQKIDPKNYQATRFIGKSGIEKQYETMLHGTVGMQSIEINAQGRILKVIDKKTPAKGQDIQLHLDYYLQKKAYAALAEHSGALVAMDVKTGGILAMVSKPSIDANQFVTGFTTQAFKKLQQSRDLPLFHRAAAGLYPPASTIKPMLALAGLETQTVDTKYTIWDPGWYKLEGSKRLFRNWKRSGHGEVNLFKAIQVSSDTYYYHLAYKLGAERMHQYLQPFGFGQKVAFDVMEENAGILPDPEWKKQRFQSSWFAGDTLNMGIGQGYFLATPLQLATATAVIANKGKWTQPRLLLKINDHSVSQPSSPSSHLAEITASPANWDFIFAAMQAVVHSKRGTATGISNNLHYQIAGKTGTAQVIGLPQNKNKQEKESELKKFTDHALFIAFAPLEKPEIAVAVIVENGGSGGAIAAPIARTVLDDYFRRKKAEKL